jgi:hypothetical protein
MINERIALVMLDGDIEYSADDRHHTRQLYKSIQGFADSSLKLCEEEKFEKLKQFLIVALRLFKEGNETVRNAIVNVYLYTLSRYMDEQPHGGKRIEPFLPQELRIEYGKMHYTSGI